MARLGILALVIASVLGACTSPPGAATSAPPASVTSSSSAASSPLSSIPGSPAEVAGLPVISVARAVGLLKTGKLDGQAVAVAGYYDATYPPCPYPGRYIGPLESWCRIVAFTDTRESAQLCQSDGGSGMSCGESSGTNLAPFFMTETSGDPTLEQTGDGTGKPVPLVIIGHAGDARQWQCTAAGQTECASAFVVDRIAWADGHDVPPVAPQTGDEQTGNPITARMTLAQVAVSVGAGADLLTGAALRAADIATVDPRWNLAGSTIVWLVRTLGPAAAAAPPETRPETEWLVDDATGKVIDSQPLKLPADFQPARLWQMATAHGVDCCADGVSAFYRVTSSAGTVVFEGRIPGGESGGADSTTFGGSYGSGPLVLPAGQYSISAWLATDTNNVVGTPKEECSTQVTLGPLGDVALNADFPLTQACTFGPAPSSSPEI